jgi:hypothetical protein
MRAQHEAPRSCVFCGRAPVSREHVWPQWLLKALRGAFESVEVVRERDVHELSSPEIMVNRVCRPCNEGWMERLESAVRPTLGPMIWAEETPRLLGYPAQRTLATWAFKTALMFDFHFPHDIYRSPPNAFAGLYRDQRPPPTCVIWTGAYGATLPKLAADVRGMEAAHRAAYTPEGVIEGTMPSPRAIITTFCIARTVLQILHVNQTERIGPPPPYPGLQQISPVVRSEILWPLNGTGFDEQSFQRLAARTMYRVNISGGHSSGAP